MLFRSAFLNFVSRGAEASCGLAKTLGAILPLLGERAGVRAVVDTKIKLRRFASTATSMAAALLFLLLCSAPSVSAAGSVEQWGVYEIALSGPTNGNPFLDVKFSARFTQGDSTIQANGFYDGDGMYRVRFMPEKTGDWRYVTESPSAELNGKKGEFTVTKPSAQNHGPVRVANTFHFAYADGSPYKQLGTTCYVWQLQD